MQIHVVRPGDTLFGVAAAYGVPLAVLASLNGLRADARLVVGQTLVVREPRLVHTAVPGDTVYSVARRYDMDARALYRNNFFLGGRSDLRAGELLVVDFADEGRLGRAETNGYA